MISWSSFAQWFRKISKGKHSTSFPNTCRACELALSIQQEIWPWDVGWRWLDVAQLMPIFSASLRPTVKLGLLWLLLKIAWELNLKLLGSEWKTSLKWQAGTLLFGPVTATSVTEIGWKQAHWSNDKEPFLSTGVGRAESWVDVDVGVDRSSKTVRRRGVPRWDLLLEHQN